MKIASICLLTACKRRKFKLFWDSSQVRAIDNGMTCCYWSASLSNRLRALKAHSSLLKCAKNCPNYMCWIQGKHRCSWVWVFRRLSVSLSLLILILFLYIFNSRGRVPLTGNSLRAEKSHWQVQKVTLAGPKSHTMAKMSHWSVIISANPFVFWRLKDSGVAFYCNHQLHGMISYTVLVVLWDDYIQRVSNVVGYLCDFDLKCCDWCIGNLSQPQKIYKPRYDDPYYSLTDMIRGCRSLFLRNWYNDTE